MKTNPKHWVPGYMDKSPEREWVLVRFDILSNHYNELKNRYNAISIVNEVEIDECVQEIMDHQLIGTPDPIIKVVGFNRDNAVSVEELIK